MEGMPLGTPGKAQLKIDRFYGLDTSQAESSLGSGFSPDTVNCCTERGILEGAVGIDAVKLPQGEGNSPVSVPLLGKQINTLGYYPIQVGTDIKHYLVAVTNEGTVYILQLNAGMRTWQKLFISDVSDYNMLDCVMVPFHQANQDWLLLFGKWDAPVRLHEEEAFYLADDAPLAGSACTHYERVFACDIADEPYNIRFSAAMDCTDWTSENAGYITVLSDMGKLIKVVSYADAVYIFHQYGISRLDAHARHTEFTVSTVWKTTEAIIPGSIANCGEQLVFATKRSLYRFNGVSVRKICPQAKELWGKLYFDDLIKAYYWDGKYMMFCNSTVVKQTLENTYNTLFKFNLNTGTLDIETGFSIWAPYLLSYPGYEGFVMSQSTSGKLYGYTGVPKDCSWRTPMTDLGHPDITKRITDVYLNISGTGTLELDVYADREKNSYTVDLSQEPQVLRVKVKGTGKRVALGVRKSSGEFKLESVVMKMDCIRDGV